MIVPDLWSSRGESTASKVGFYLGNMQERLAAHIPTHHLILLHVVLFLHVWGDTLRKSPWLRCFKSDRDEIWQDCSSSK